MTSPHNAYLYATTQRKPDAAVWLNLFMFSITAGQQYPILDVEHAMRVGRASKKQRPLVEQLLPLLFEQKSNGQWIAKVTIDSAENSVPVQNFCKNCGFEQDEKPKMIKSESFEQVNAKHPVENLSFEQGKPLAEEPHARTGNINYLNNNNIYIKTHHQDLSTPRACLDFETQETPSGGEPIRTDDDVFFKKIKGLFLAKALGFAPFLESVQRAFNQLESFEAKTIFIDAVEKNLARWVTLCKNPKNPVPFLKTCINNEILAVLGLVESAEIVKGTPVAILQESGIPSHAQARISKVLNAPAVKCKVTGKVYRGEELRGQQPLWENGMVWFYLPNRPKAVPMTVVELVLDCFAEQELEASHWQGRVGA